MGVDNRRPPLPAPTEPSTLSSVDNNTPIDSDLATDLSRRTDKTSYSIPEDGTPITINTAKKGLGSRKYPSQTSLLIEYFEGGKEGDSKPNKKPSVRVRVTPSHRKSKSTSNDHVQITQTSRNPRKPSYTRRISLHGVAREDTGSYSEESNVSSIPPVEVEVLGHGSDLSSNGGRYIPVTSDISSIPPDSMLAGSPVIRTPPRPSSRSLETTELVETVAQETLQAPITDRSRSSSKDRLTQKIMAQIHQKTPEAAAKAKDAKTSREELTPSRKSRHRTSRSSREEELSAMSGTESSLLSSNVRRRSGDAHSVRSGVSGTSSINNPKLLATVEDAIKRLILPELNALKEEQKTQKNRDKFDRIPRRDSTEDYRSISREASLRRVSKVTSAPDITQGSKPKVVLNRHGDDPGTLLSGGSSHKGRRSSRGSISERSYTESVEEEKLHRKKSRDKDRKAAAAAGVAAMGLTAAALRHHDSRESSDDKKERRRRKHSRSSRSRSTSVAESIEEEHRNELVPPMPLLPSELVGSDMTRESIRSAETETKERPESRSSRSSRATGVETPLHEVRRGPFHVVSPAPRTPTRTPLALQRGLGTPKSNRSQNDLSLSGQKSDRSIRTREASSAALDAAAAAKARALESNEPPVSQYEIDQQTPTRALSPVQSEASYREEARGSPQTRSARSAASLSSAGRKAQRQGSNLSIQSLESLSSTKMARTRKRPQGVNLETSRELLVMDEPKDAEEFFAQNHEQNEMYRRELQESQDSPADYKHMSAYTEISDTQYLEGEDKLDIGQDIRAVGSNPEYVHTPLAVESAVASLHEPSNISVRSSVSSPLKKGMAPPQSPGQFTLDRQTSEQSLQTPNSQERWEALRDQAQALTTRTRDPKASDSPRQSVAKSVDEPIEMKATAFPIGGEMDPEIGWGVDDDESEVTTNPSIIKGPLGATSFPSNDRLSQHESGHTHSYGQSAAMGLGAGVAALAAKNSSHMHHDNDPALREPYQPGLEDDFDDDYNEDYGQQTPVRSPAMWKDEGYQSAQHGGVTPETRNRSRMLDDSAGGFGTPDVFSNSNHVRYPSGNSHGMSSPLYDAATGRGIDRIQSKDVVALMDHLTVRDGQRNARDTEILVTLVRSAAEMRDSFEEMKQFIRTQDAMILNSMDKRADLTEQRIMGGPRPMPAGGSARVLRSSTEEVDVEQKRKNVFRRALKGLSMKGDSDIKNIERMLVQLLGEVEGLKQAQAMAMPAAPPTNRANSLSSYENLRASGDPGYEPEGRADTAPSPNQSGYLSNPSSRRIQDLHSGYDIHQPHRISTVEEDDEEYEENGIGGQYENTERMTTPTQEARRNNALAQETPPQASKPFRESQSLENTPKRKHKSNTSSIFGIPKISRWSKTTASTNPESMPRNSGSSEKRPYSDASRSGSQVNVVYYADDNYEVQADDRLRSSTSLPPKQQAPSIRSAASVRSASPLIPDDEDLPIAYVDDPKYQAHRNSLNLQHPQPRPGPTHRHQSHLESQAQMFADPEPVRSPDFDQWGSNPSLARNRLSGGHASHQGNNLSPISSGGEYSPNSPSGQAPPRPPKIRDDGGPLVPMGVPMQQQPLAGHGQTRQMYSSPNEFGSQGALTPLAPIQEVRYSLETDGGRGGQYSPSPSPRPTTSNQNLTPQRKITGPRPMGSKSPSGGQGFERSGTVVRKNGGMFDC